MDETLTEPCICCGLPIGEHPANYHQGKVALPIGQGEFCTCPDVGWCETCGVRCCDHGCQCEKDD